MSKSLVFKKVINGETNYWLSLRNILGEKMPSDMQDILVRIFVTKKDSAWTKKIIEKKINKFENEISINIDNFELPTGECKIIMKNGKIIDLHNKDQNNTNH